MQKPNRTWAEVDLDAIVHNFKEFQRLAKAANPDRPAKVMGVVKANAYGHGSVSVSRALVEAGAERLAVAALDEAIELKDAGISVPVLVFNHISKERYREAARYGIPLTVFSEEEARAASEAGKAEGRALNIHIKLDTGMTRVGFNVEDAVPAILRIAALEGCKAEGLFTHFAVADEIAGEEYTEMQFGRYMSVVRELEEKGLHISVKHVCNSAGAINFPHMHLDVIRPGISLYGCYPSNEVDREKIDLRPAMAFKTEVLRINHAKDGVSVSYGRTYTTKGERKLCTIPAGYADGYTRTLSGKAKVLINGQEAPVVGRICMDQCVIDCTDIKGEVVPGSEVVLFGAQGDKTILADDLGALIGTINYEITCMVARRVPRFYLRDGKMLSEENYLIDVD